MSKQTQELTKMHPEIIQFQKNIRARFSEENQAAKKGQIVFVGSSLMEIFPIEKMQKERDLGLDKVIYNRGIRATTTADLLANMDLQLFDLAPSKIFINIGSNDVSFGVSEVDFLENYAEILRKIKSKLPDAKVYVMAYYPVNAIANFGESDHDHAVLFQSRTNETMAVASEKVAAVAKQFGYQPINVNDGLTDNDGNLKTEFTFDGTHMLPDGYEIVLNNLKKYL